MHVLERVSAGRAERYPDKAERYPDKAERYPDKAERYPDAPGTLSRWLQFLPCGLLLSLCAELDSPFGDDLQPLKFAHGVGQCILKLSHGTGVLHFFFEPISRVLLRRV